MKSRSTKILAKLLMLTTMITATEYVMKTPVLADKDTYEISKDESEIRQDTLEEYQEKKEEEQKELEDKIEEIREKRSEKKENDLVISCENGDIQLSNETTREFVSVEIAANNLEDIDTENTDAENSAAGDETEGNATTDEADKDKNESPLYTLTIIEEDGTEHIFEQVNPETWTSPKLLEMSDILYILYTDENGDTQEIWENMSEDDKEKLNEIIEEKSEELSKEIQEKTINLH